MPRKILTVGYTIPGRDSGYVDIDSDRSLLDGDIIVFQPGIPYSYHEYGEQNYQGKPTLGKSGSFRAVEHSRHWKGELHAALEDGKTVIVFLAKPVEVYVYTGQKEFSGTGRNRQTTNYVSLFSSYSALPVSLGTVTPKHGEEIKVAGPLGALTEYWKEFGPQSPYRVYVDGKIGSVLLTTKTGRKTVGAIGKIGRGHIVFVPPIEYDEGEFTSEDEAGEATWNDKALQFSARLEGILVRLDAQLRVDSTLTAPPNWSSRDEYRMVREKAIDTEVATLNEQLEGIRKRREGLLSEATKEAGLRRLLYGTGPELEAAILDALRLLGYKAENVKVDDSEFDAVFVSPEGDRFLGEAEGKDTKSINIDKLSQLERNIQEDFARDEVEEPARGVLFGNAFRHQDPKERQDFFTDKCLSGAKRSGTALVRTPDLFLVAQYLRDHDNEELARRCRDALRDSLGAIVRFPPVPK